MTFCIFAIKGELTVAFFFCFFFFVFFCFLGEGGLIPI